MLIQYEDYLMHPRMRLLFTSARIMAKIKVKEA